MKNKACILFFLNFICVSLFAQFEYTGTPIQKKVLVIGNKWTDTCSTKAIIVMKDSVLTDYCYNNNDGTFSINKKEKFSQDSFYLNLFIKTTNEWLIIQNTLNTIERCDFAIPFKIVVSENNSTKSFSLKRFSNCYPASVKQTMESLELYFNNLK